MEKEKKKQKKANDYLGMSTWKKIAFRNLVPFIKGTYGE